MYIGTCRQHQPYCGSCGEHRQDHHNDASCHQLRPDHEGQLEQGHPSTAHVDDRHELREGEQKRVAPAQQQGDCGAYGLRGRCGLKQSHDGKQDRRCEQKQPERIEPRERHLRRADQGWDENVAKSSEQARHYREQRQQQRILGDCGIDDRVGYADQLRRCGENQSAAVDQHIGHTNGAVTAIGPPEGRAWGWCAMRHDTFPGAVATL